MTPEIRDPSEDREEFEIRLKSVFENLGRKFLEEAVEALVLQDEESLTRIRTQIQANKDKVKSYLDQWDAVQDKESKQQIISGVKR